MTTIPASYQLLCCSRHSPFNAQGCTTIPVLTIQAN